MSIDITVKILHRIENSIEYEELKVFTSTGTVTFEFPYCDRNYALFELLGENTTCHEKYIPCQRGIFEFAPKEVTRIFNDYTYSQTWFDWCELLNIVKILKHTKGYRKNNYKILKKWVQDLKFVLDIYKIYFPNPSDVIIQIGFDN